MGSVCPSEKISEYSLKRLDHTKLLDVYVLVKRISEAPNAHRFL
jgi:hypothetical protein